MVVEILGFVGKFFAGPWRGGEFCSPGIAGAFLLIWLLMWLFVGLAFLAYQILLIVLVVRDAQRRGANVPVWSILTFFFGPFVVLPYLLVRKEAEVKKDV